MDVTTLRLLVKQEYLRIIAGLIETGALDLETVKEPTKKFQTSVNVTVVDDLKKISLSFLKIILCLVILMRFYCANVMKWNLRK